MSTFSRDFRCDPSQLTLDCETAILLRAFLMPAIDAARTWAELSQRLERMGYEIAFREGRLIFRRIDSGDEVCTGGTLGTPLRDLASRLGRPCILAGTDGHTGRLMI